MQALGTLEYVRLLLSQIHEYGHAHQDQHKEQQMIFMYILIDDESIAKPAVIQRLFFWMCLPCPWGADCRL